MNFAVILGLALCSQFDPAWPKADLLSNLSSDIGAGASPRAPALISLQGGEVLSLGQYEYGLVIHRLRRDGANLAAIPLYRSPLGLSEATLVHASSSSILIAEGDRVLRIPLDGVTPARVVAEGPFSRGQRYAFDERFSLFWSLSAPHWWVATDEGVRSIEGPSGTWARGRSMGALWFAGGPNLDLYRFDPITFEFSLALSLAEHSLHDFAAADGFLAFIAHVQGQERWYVFDTNGMRLLGAPPPALNGHPVGNAVHYLQGRNVDTRWLLSADGSTKAYALEGAGPARLAADRLYLTANGVLQALRPGDSETPSLTVDVGFRSPLQFLIPAGPTDVLLSRSPEAEHFVLRILDGPGGRVQVSGVQAHDIEASPDYAYVSTTLSPLGGNVALVDLAAASKVGEAQHPYDDGSSDPVALFQDYDRLYFASRPVTPKRNRRGPSRLWSTDGDEARIESDFEAAAAVAFQGRWLVGGRDETSAAIYVFEDGEFERVWAADEGADFDRVVRLQVVNELLIVTVEIEDSPGRLSILTGPEPNSLELRAQSDEGRPLIAGVRAVGADLWILRGHEVGGPMEIARLRADGEEAPPSWTGANPRWLDWDKPWLTTYGADCEIIYLRSSGPEVIASDEQGYCFGAVDGEDLLVQTATSIRRFTPDGEVASTFIGANTGWTLVREVEGGYLRRLTPDLAGFEIGRLTPLGVEPIPGDFPHDMTGPIGAAPEGIYYWAFDELSDEGGGWRLYHYDGASSEIVVGPEYPNLVTQRDLRIPIAWSNKAMVRLFKPGIGLEPHVFDTGEPPSLRPDAGLSSDLGESTDADRGGVADGGLEAPGSLAESESSCGCRVSPDDRQPGWVLGVSFCLVFWVTRRGSRLRGRSRHGSPPL